MAVAPKLVPLPDLLEPSVAAGAAFALGALRGGSLHGQRGFPLTARGAADASVLRILVVEPDERARSLLQLGLGREGFEVLAVGSAEDALRELAPHRPVPAMVVVEAELRGTDGFALCGQLRAEQRTAHLPIILMSSRPDSIHRELATGAGADDYLPKPLFVNDVVALAKLKAGRASGDVRFDADTENLPLAAVLRALLAGMRSGRVELRHGAGELAFRSGRVHAARFGPLEGEAALGRMLLLAEGAYSVTFGPALGEGAMHYGLRDLCGSLLPQLLRWQQTMPLSVPLESQLTVDFVRLAAAERELPRDVERVMSLADGTRRVRDIVVDSPLAPLPTLQVLTRLYAMAVLVPVPGSLLPDLAWTETEAAPVQLPAPAVVAPLAERWFEDVDRAQVPSELAELGPEAPTPSIRTPSANRAAAAEPLLPSAEAAAPLEALPSAEELFFAGGLRRDEEVTEPNLPVTASSGEEQGPELDVMLLPRRLGVRHVMGAALFVAIVTGVAGGALYATRKVVTPAPSPAAARVVVAAEPIAIEGSQDAAPEAEALTPELSLQLAKAEALYDHGKAAAAAGILESMTQAHPALAQAWLVLGLARYDLRDARGAQAAAQNALALDPSEARVQLLLASVYQQAHDVSHERAALEQYLALASDGPFAKEAKQLLSELPAVVGDGAAPVVDPVVVPGAAPPGVAKPVLRKAVHAAVVEPADEPAGPAEATKSADVAPAPAAAPKTDDEFAPFPGK